MSRLPTAIVPDLPAPSPIARRELSVLGAPVELVGLPSRRARGQATGDRPAVAASPARRILATESHWQDDELALTPNRFPFADQQQLLWSRTPRREPDAAMWAAAAAWCAATGGTALGNTIGAAATIAWAHLHLTPERLGWLAALPERAPRAELPALPTEVEAVAKDLPCGLLGLRSADPDALGHALAELSVSRLLPANNVCIADGTAWSFPRRIETPTPHFPYALGAAELWGRWCYLDQAPLQAATAADLEAALTAAGAAPL